jgi:hypothetical protein
VGGHARRVHAVDSQEHHVDVEPFERALGERSDQLVRLGTSDAARDHQPDRLAHDQLGSDVDGVGYYGQVTAA